MARADVCLFVVAQTIFRRQVTELLDRIEALSAVRPSPTPAVVH